MEHKDQNLYAIASHITHTVELPDFMEDLTKSTFRWRREGESAVCNCPMSWHTDRNASFHMNKMDDGVWVYQCFGCHSKGNVISFYMEYTGEDDFKSAIMNICKKLNIKCDEDIQIQSYKYVVNRVDKKREMETSNIVTSNMCRRLLVKNFDKHYEWVMSAYKRLNKALSDDNYEEIEKIGYEASKKFVE